MVFPKEAQEFFNRGMEQLHDGNWQGALDDFSEAIKLRPDVSLGWRFRSYAHSDGGNHLRAIADLDEAIRLKPDDVQSYYDRGQHLLRQKLFDQALVDCDKGIELDAARADFFGLRGRINAARGQSEHALADFSHAIELDPEGGADYLQWRGELFLELDDPASAINDFTAALLREPDRAAALAQRAHAYAVSGDTHAAIADFNQAVELDPKSYWLRARRGAIHKDAGEYHEAIVDFSRAIEIKPDFILAYEYRAEARAKLGDLPAAIADLTEAIRLQPEGLQAVRIYNSRAQQYYRRREYARAIRDHMEALKKEPEHAATFNALAWIWCTAPDPSVRNGRRALECATRACELTEWGEAGFIDTLAAAHAELGEFQEAMAQAGKAAEVATDDQSREEFESRIELFENRRPLRVTPE